MNWKHMCGWVWLGDAFVFFIWAVCRQLFDWCFKVIEAFHALNRVIDLVHANVCWEEQTTHTYAHTHVLQFKRRYRFMRGDPFFETGRSKRRQRRIYNTQTCYVNEDDMLISSPTESECIANSIIPQCFVFGSWMFWCLLCYFYSHDFKNSETILELWGSK